MVAGGATFDYVFGAPAYPILVHGSANTWSETGAKFVYLFDPAALSAVFPGSPTASPFYTGSYGQWRQGPNNLQLEVDRYYPTVTLTHALQRTLTHTVLISGGDPSPTSTLPANPLTSALNSYEALRIRNPPIAPASFLQKDDVNGVKVFVGPGTAPTMASYEEDWLQDYPRLHLLSDGKVFLSGQAWKSAKVNHDQAPPQTLNGWDTSTGGSAPWQHARRDGSSVFFGTFGPWHDVVVRMCGSAIQAPPGQPMETNSAEMCFATMSGAPWIPLPSIPPSNQPRTTTNAVVLPDASIVVIGGANAGGPVLETVQFRLGSQWQTLPNSPTARRYHATAVLLPDGRVLVGGGEGRHGSATPSPHDYDILEPAYVSSPKRPTQLDLPNAARLSDGTYRLDSNQLDVSLTCTIDTGAVVQKVVFMAPGAMTHHSDMSARYVEAAVTLTELVLPAWPSASTVGAQEAAFAVPDDKTLPKGYYMLFAVGQGGIPSSAIWVRIE